MNAKHDLGCRFADQEFGNYRRLQEFSNNDAANVLVKVSGHTPFDAYPGLTQRQIVKSP
jgi:hypothetical protein